MFPGPLSRANPWAAPAYGLPPPGIGFGQHFGGGFNPQYAANLPPQTWMGPQFSQHHQYAEALLGGQHNPYAGTGIAPHSQAGWQPYQQLNPWTQSGFGPTTPFGQILAQALLANLYWQSQQGAGGQYGFGRSPFGYGGYPFM